MQEAKNTARSLVRLGYDGRVYKTFRGSLAKERFEHEVRVLKYLEKAAFPSTWLLKANHYDPDLNLQTF